MADSSTDEFIREAQERYNHRDDFLNTLQRKAKSNSRWALIEFAEKPEENSNDTMCKENVDDTNSSFQSAKLTQSEVVKTNETANSTDFASATCGSITYMNTAIETDGSLDESNLFLTFGTRIANRERSPSVDRVSIGRRTYGEAFGPSEEPEKPKEQKESGIVRRVSQNSAKSSRHESPTKNVLTRVAELSNNVPKMSPKVADVPFNKGSHDSVSLGSARSSVSTTPSRNSKVRPLHEGLRHVDSSFDDNGTGSVPRRVHYPSVSSQNAQSVFTGAESDSGVAVGTRTGRSDSESTVPNSVVDREEEPMQEKDLDVDPPTENQQYPVQKLAPPPEKLISPIPMTLEERKPSKFFESEARQQAQSTPIVVEPVPGPLRTPAPPSTADRSGLIDEINADFQRVQQNSLPRPTRGTDHCDGTPIRSLRDVRSRQAGELSAKRPDPERAPTPVHDGASEEQKSKYASEVLKFLVRGINVNTTQYQQAKRALQLIVNKAERDEDEVVTSHLIMLQCRAAVEAAMRMRELIVANANNALLPEMKAAFTFNRAVFEIHPEFQRQILVEPISCYFALVITHRDKVKCSPYVNARKHNKGRIEMDMYFILDNVGPGFEIFVEIFMLKLHRKEEEKKGLMAEFMGTLLRGGHQQHRAELSEMDCAFTRLGAATINSSNMRSHTLKSETVQPLMPRIELLYDFQLTETSQTFQGMVRRLEQVGGVSNWAGEFALFANWHLSFWQSQRDFLEKKPFLRSVNLRRAFRVTEVENTACYPFAFSVDYVSAETDQKETREDQEAWLQVLDGFVKLINFWKHT